MKSTLKQGLIYLGIACILVIFSYVMNSTFLSTFLDSGVIALLVTVLAINVASISIILSKIQDIELKYDRPSIFNETSKESKNAINEQLILLGLAFILIICRSGNLLNDQSILDPIQQVMIRMLLDILLMTIVIWFLDIIRDTGLSLYELRKQLEILIENGALKKSNSNNPNTDN